eukprot:3631858-Prymnesium_polylepis.1
MHFEAKCTNTPTLDPENRYAGRRALSKSLCSKQLVSQNAQISIHTNGTLEGRVPLHRKAPTGHCIGNPPRAPAIQQI